MDRDGNLFVIIGDRAPTPPSDYGQQNDTTIGKVLHLTPEGKPVAGNPYIGKAGYAPEVYSMGHRSPEGLAINPANGELWETEHSPQGGDELNKIEARTMAGRSSPMASTTIPSRSRRALWRRREWSSRATTGIR